MKNENKFYSNSNLNLFVGSLKKKLKYYQKECIKIVDQIIKILSFKLPISTMAILKMFQSFHVLTLASLKSNELEIITIFTARAHTHTTVTQ